MINLEVFDKFELQVIRFLGMGIFAYAAYKIEDKFKMLVCYGLGLIVIELAMMALK